MIIHDVTGVLTFGDLEIGKLFRCVNDPETVFQKTKHTNYGNAIYTDGGQLTTFTPETQVTRVQREAQGELRHPVLSNTTCGSSEDTGIERG